MQARRLNKRAVGDFTRVVRNAKSSPYREVEAAARPTPARYKARIVAAGGGLSITAEISYPCTWPKCWKSTKSSGLGSFAKSGGGSMPKPLGPRSSSRSNGSKSIGGTSARARNSACWSSSRTTGPRACCPWWCGPRRQDVGKLRVLTFPLHDWGSFYGPIGPDATQTLDVGLAHLHQTPRDWDILELRWQGVIGIDPAETQRAMLAAGFPAYVTVWDRTAIVELAGTWESYWAGRQRAWLRRFRHAERKLAEQGEITYVRYRPLGTFARRRLAPLGSVRRLRRACAAKLAGRRPPTAPRFRTKRCADSCANRTTRPRLRAPSI